MRRWADVRAAMQQACAIACILAALDFTIRFLHPGLAASRSALLAAMILHAIPMMAVAAAVLASRRGAGRVPAILIPLGALMLFGGLANLLFLPGLLTPRSLLFDALAVAICVALAAALMRLPRAGRRATRLSAIVILVSLATGFWARREATAGIERGEAAKAQGPDLIVVLFDALRADRSSVYGHDRDTTPRLREVAAESLVFENAYAPSSWTKPSVATLFTGVLPPGHGNHRISSALPSTMPLVPELLSAGGYRCGVFSENSFVSPLFGYDRGVERIVANEPDVVAQTTLGHLLQQLAVRSPLFVPVLDLALRANRFDPRQRFKDRGGLDVVAAALSWLDEVDPEDRVFLYVHLMKPHAPYIAPEPYDGAFGAPDGGADDPSLRPPHVEGLGPFARADGVDEETRLRMLANYDERLLYGDALFGQLIDGLRARGRYDEALLIALSDHGEEFGERGLWDHGHSLQEGVLRIPLLLREPGVAPRRVSELARLFDVPSTLLDAAKVARAPGIEGQDLRAREGVERVDYSSLAQLRHGPGFEMEALLHGGRKLVHSVDGDREAWQLFELAADPAEAEDLSALLAADLKAMREELELSLQNARRWNNEETDVELDAETVERLRALGYVQ